MVTTPSLDAQKLDAQCAALKTALRVPYNVSFPRDLLSKPSEAVKRLASAIQALEVKPSVIFLVHFDTAVLYHLVAAISKLPLGFPDQVRMGPQVISYMEAFKPAWTELDGNQTSQLSGSLLGIVNARASRGLAVLLQRRFRKLTVLQMDHASSIEAIGLMSMARMSGYSNYQIAYFDGRGL